VNTVGIVLSVFCGVTALISASGKLTKQQPVVEILDHVKVTGTLRSMLPFIQIAGGLGAIVGLVVLPAVGVAALIGLALYFVGAVVFHLRVGDGIDRFGVPLGLAAVMAAAAIIRAITI
jgi:hypothetical protein